MSADGLALLVLTATLALVVAGLRELAAGSRARATVLERASATPPPGRLRVAGRAAEARFARTRPGRAIGARLVAAGLEHVSALQFALAAGGAAVAGGLVASLFFSRMICAFAATLAAFGCWWWLDRRREARQRKLIGQLPQAARLLSNAASAGLSVVVALERAVDELEEPLAGELRLAVEEVRLGVPFDVALDHVADRVGSRELGVLVHTLVIQQRAGGDLVRALADMATTLEARRDTLREVRTLMAGAVASAYVVPALCVGTLLLLDLISPGMLDDMTRHPVGLAIVGASGAAFAVALALCRRVTRIET